MDKQLKIVGITGHRNIGNAESQAWVRKAMDAQVKQLQISKGLTSLAIGADQLFAELLITHNIPYSAVIPCKNYESTFDGQDLQAYRHLLKKAANMHEMAFSEPADEAFWSAGQYIVDQSDLLIAIWDGQPAKGLGGTGDAVEYALTSKVPIVQINPVTHQITFNQ